MSDTVSYVEIARGTKVRTLVSRNYCQGWDAEARRYLTVEPVEAGVTATVDSCSHAGFRGRVHWVRLDDGRRIGEFSANELEILERPANPRYTTHAPERYQR